MVVESSTHVQTQVRNFLQTTIGPPPPPPPPVDIVLKLPSFTDVASMVSLWYKDKLFEMRPSGQHLSNYKKIYCFMKTLRCFMEHGTVIPNFCDYNHINRNDYNAMANTVGKQVQKNVTDFIIAREPATTSKTTMTCIRKASVWGTLRKLNTYASDILPPLTVRDNCWVNVVEFL